MTTSTPLTALAAAAGLAVTLAAQQPPAFHAEARLLVLHVTVSNAHGERVTNLDRGSFAVFEDGRQQPIAFFRRDDVPTSLGLIIDNSGSMRALRRRVEAAALAFVRASNPLDEVSILNFADTPRIDVPFTNDVRVLEAGVTRVDAIGGTAMKARDCRRTHGLKYAVRRDRPTGECCAFPSGHASVTFATATVLERHLGYRASWPMFAIAGYVSVSRLTDNRHFLSDVLFGSALGMATGWTVVGRHGRENFSLYPVPVRGGVVLAGTWSPAGRHRTAD
jgi:membrane-associated phospholipid phosphatase